ncbi:MULTISPECIES: cation:proton antiporter [Campylobacter]|uniref:cation:proton antiporter n=1 Tax=Campylobacter TaxID=194 RepID=UPI0023F4D263|nr:MULTISPECIES: cation:proton antiporter [Campylobacter]MCI6642209.1 cation:proton antiporter [Campylobacter sp.]MDD7422320.1 cation:proton antiporter [Campylobacter hominis]MDY3116743.1 cation:proton antiporter [Campylobacter hominis]
MELFLELFLIVSALAIVLNVIFKMFEIPTIIGYIVTGICLNHIYNLSNKAEISHVAEFGIVFLMFTIGLEFSLKYLMQMKKDVFLNGILQMSISTIFFAFAAYEIFGINIKAAIIIGSALSLSSTAIVLKILNDRNQISQIYGRKALGILLFQDIAVIPILLMIDIFGSTDSTPVIYLILKTCISAVIVIGLLFLIGKYLFNAILNKILQTDSKEIFLISILFTVVGASFITHIFGFSYTLGAFIAGIIIAETEYKDQIEAVLIPFRDILLGLFFITVGMQINFDTIKENYGLILALVFVIMTIKTLIVYFILYFSVKRRVAFKTAISISQIGEFALAIFSIMFAHSAISQTNAQILISTVVITMIITPFILKNINVFANRFEGDITSLTKNKIKLAEIKHHFIVCGYGRLGQEVVLKLKNQGLLHIVIESDLTLVELGKSRGENIYFGDMTRKSTLIEANIANADGIILTVSNEQKLMMIAKNIASLNMPSDVVVRYTGADEKKLFSDFGEKFRFIKEERAIANVLVQEAIQCKIEKHSAEI